MRCGLFLFGIQFEKQAKLLFCTSFTYLFTVIANDVYYTSITQFIVYKQLNRLFSIYFIIIIIIIIIAKTSKAPFTGAQRRRTVHAYT